MTVDDVRTGLKEVPGDGGLPIVGYTFDVLSGKLYNSRERYDKYGPVSWLNAFGRRQVTVTGPEAATVVLQNRDRAFASGPGWGFLIGQVLPPRSDAARLRGAPPAPADHAAGVHVRAARRLPRADERDARRRPRRAGSRARLPVLPRAQATHARRRDAHVHGRATSAPRPTASTAHSSTACAPAPRCSRFPVPGLRWSRGLKGRRELEQFLYPRIAAQTRRRRRRPVQRARPRPRRRRRRAASATTTSSTT